MKCQECKENDGVHHDPRQPPLSGELCICHDCFQWVADERIDELADETKALIKEKEDF